MLLGKTAMFNASELEGEVDHSFFDSDCDNSTRDGGEKTEKGLEAKKQSPTAHQRSPAKNYESTDDGLSSRTERSDKHLKQVEKNKRSRVSAVSPVSYTSDKVISDESDSENDSDVHSKRPGRTFLSLLADGQEGYDVYNQTPNEMEEKALTFSANQKRKNEQSTRKLVKSRHIRNQSPSSAEASADADSESSCSSRRSNLGSPTLLKSTKSSSHPGVRRTRLGSAGSRDVLNSSTDESDDTVTDVSPLSSPESSRLQSLDLNNSEVEEESHEEQLQESMLSSGLNNMKQEEDSYQDMDERSLSLESHLGHELVFHCPGRRYRKNYSFTNDEVWRIDRENKRLLCELSRLSPGSRPGSTARKKIHVASNTPPIRLSHSALNRKREQQRIEQENLTFLKRLESVKPTQGLSRSEQLADYQRQAEYLGRSSCPIHRSTTRKEKDSSRTSLGSFNRSQDSEHQSSFIF
ncbi:cilia- and flagella-associated protein 97 isoform X2 [Melanotaenia boesemani]|uniref:cilia- and flagella-associated protein 97 isoform X2 n=1 Tax=Melanotaenia boesemani TaxID=1250792 RepID=UPI001C049C5C|nr:cilia- and flagella-associated protein 97 isoform X2 [Melanotaenia boesemani]